MAASTFARAHREAWSAGVHVSDAQPVLRSGHSTLWAFKAPKGSAATHTFMTGGNLKVEQDKTGDFLRAHLAAVVAAGANAYALPTTTERVPKDAHYRFFADLDIKVTPDQVRDGVDGVPLATRHDRRAALHTLAQCCAVSVAEAYACKAPLRVIALRAGEETQPDGAIKSGLHVVLPDIIVNQPTAQALYAHMKAALGAAAGAAFLQDAIDEAPLKNGGLRLPFAGKGAKATAACTDCNEACQRRYLHKRDALGDFLPQRVMSAGRPYMVDAAGHAVPANAASGGAAFAYVEDAAELERLTDAPLELLKICILKQPPTAPLTAGLTIPTAAAVAPAAAARVAGTKRKAAAAPHARERDAAGGLGDAESATVWEDMELTDAQIARLQDTLWAQPAMAAYPSVRVAKVARTPHTVLHGVDIVVVTLDAKVCPRTGVEHASNHAYLRVIGHFATILCRDEGCADFRSRPFSLPLDVEASLRVRRGCSAEFSDCCIVPSVVVADDAFAATEFARQMGARLVLDGTVWAFDDSRGIWSFDTALLNRLVTRCGDALVLVEEPRDARPPRKVSYSGSTQARERLIAMLPSVLPQQRDYFMADGRAQSDVGKLLFRDGIYDFKSATFTRGFDPAVTFFAGVPHDFPPRVEADVAWLKQTVFREPFEVTDDGACENGAILLHDLMRGAIGDYLRKKGLMAIGRRNCGKGTIVLLSKNAFGSDLVGEFDVNNMIAGRVSSEPARALDWAYDGLHRRRLAFSNEVHMGPAVALEAGGVRSLISGGDELRSRAPYGKAVGWINRATLFIFSNQPIPIKPCGPDTAEKFNVATWHYSFVPLPQLGFEKPSIEGLKAKFSGAAMRGAFFWLLADEYARWQASGYAEPKPSESNRELLDEVLPVPTCHCEQILVDGGYELTGNKRHCVATILLGECLVRGGVDPSVASTELSRLFGAAKTARLPGKPAKARFGVRVKPAVEADAPAMAAMAATHDIAGGDAGAVPPMAASGALEAFDALVQGE